MNHSGTIILPVAGRSSRFPGMRPKWLLTAPTGELMLQKSLESVPDWRNRRVVVGALDDHLDGQGGMTALERAFGDGVEIVRFSDVTSGPAETVEQIIRRASITGPIFIKDCDSWFCVDDDVFRDCVCYADLRKCPDVRNIPGKSFLHMNENELLLGIIEKNVSSNFISVGGYGFHDAEIFLDAYDANQKNDASDEQFVSHVILEAIRTGAVFSGVQVTDYVDVGTIEAWNNFRNDQALYIVDIDGVLLRNAGQYSAPFWDDMDVAITPNIETMKKMIAKGAQVILVTARPERYRAKTESFLTALGLTWHAAIFGVQHAHRTLINDFAKSNPYPSARAVNLPRNSDDLESLFGSLRS